MFRAAQIAVLNFQEERKQKNRRQMMKRIWMFCLWGIVAGMPTLASPLDGLLERIDEGASRKFIVERKKSAVDFFELDQKGD